jgi:YebC/PmpR family DNA-binding regulatory protein
LRAAVAVAKEENMPADNIMRAIKKGTGELEGVNYEEIRYEGYGINGASIIIDCLTDNKQRAVADVRHALTKFGGNLGTDGSVAFMFKHCGSLVYEPGTNEDKVMEVALDAGAEDVVSDEDGSIEVITAPNDFMAVKEAMEAAGLKAVMAEVTMKPMNEIELSGDDALKMQKILDALDDLDDVQDVYTSALIDD